MVKREILRELILKFERKINNKKCENNTKLV